MAGERINPIHQDMKPGNILLTPEGSLSGYTPRFDAAAAAAALERHPHGGQPALVRVHTRHLSRMIGAGRANLHALKKRFLHHPFTVHGDDRVGPHHLEVIPQDAPSG